MQEKTWMETVKVEGGQLLDYVKQVVQEGNVRRIVVKQGEHTMAEFPLTIGVVGAVFAPMLAAVGALAALLTDCTIEIERVTKPQALVKTPEGPLVAVEPTAHPN